jgi:hypothetical protein
MPCSAEHLVWQTKDFGQVEVVQGGQGMDAGFQLVQSVPVLPNSDFVLEPGF